MLELLDQDYYENAVKKYSAKWDVEIPQKWRQEGYNDGWKEGRDDGWKEGHDDGWKGGRDRGRREGQVDECVRSIRRCLKKRFPNEPLSVNCDCDLQSLEDMKKLISIQDYCFDATSIQSIEAFIESKVSD